jgi:hypothetical protein
MGLLPEMMHPVLDGIRLAKDDLPASMRGEGFVWFADRLLDGTGGPGPKPEDALHFLLQAAELGVSGAYLRIGRMCETGTGTEKNPELAKVAYLKAGADDVDADSGAGGDQKTEPICGFAELAACPIATV